MISRRKYNYLKQLSESALTDADREQIEEFEKANGSSDKSEFLKAYSAKVFKEEPTPENFKPSYEILLKKFKAKYKELEGVEFNEDMIPNIEPVLYYFAKDERFFDCNNLSDKSTPSFRKGLLIVGSYGNGKTSTMRTLKQLFSYTPLSFKSFVANRVVSEFEGHSIASERSKCLNRTKTGVAYFDDVKTEKIASNYGKHNLFKDIIEERYINKAKTFITCNYRQGDSTNSLDEALNEFNFIYGGRVYDRLFAMFNIIEFNGKSQRK